MKRFILFLTTLILLPIALQAQISDTIEDNSGFVWDSLKVEDGVIKRYGKFDGEPIIEIIEPKRSHKESKKEFNVRFGVIQPTEYSSYSSGITPDGAREDGIDIENCTFKGVPLKGRVKIVESNADFRVRFVQYRSLADIVVETATGISRSDPCCTWQFVTSNADFTVKIDNNFPDLNVYVNDSNIDYYEKYKDY